MRDLHVFFLCNIVFTNLDKYLDTRVCVYIYVCVCIHTDIHTYITALSNKLK